MPSSLRRRGSIGWLFRAREGLDAPFDVKGWSCCSVGVEPGVVTGREFGVADLSALESGDGVDRPLEVLRDGLHRDSEGVPSRAQGGDVGGRLGVGEDWWTSRATYRLDSPSAVLRAM